MNSNCYGYSVKFITAARVFAARAFPAFAGANEHARVACIFCRAGNFPAILSRIFLLLCCYVESYKLAARAI